MKLKDYINKLQELYREHGDVDVKNKTILNFETCSNEDDILIVADNPHYDKEHKCIVVYEEII